VLIVKTLRSNSLVLVYNATNLDGKTSSKSASFKFINENNTDEDNFEIATSIGSILAYAPKEVRHDQSHILMEG